MSVTIKRHLLFALLLPVLALVSCTKEESGADNPATREYTFTLNVPGGQTAARSMEEDDEYTVTTADVLAFDHATGKFLYYAYGKNKIESAGGSGEDRRVKFTVSLQDKEKSSYDFIVLTNARKAINAVLGSITVHSTKDDVQALIAQTLTAGTGWVTSGTGFMPIPMWGEINDTALSTENNYSATLVRMLARIDLSVSLDPMKHDPADELKLLQVRLYNYQTAGLVIPASGNLGTNGKGQPKVTAPSVPAGKLNTANPITYTVPVTGPDAGKLLREIYTFEAPAGSKADYRNNICLVFQAEYTPAGGSTTTGWYRLDFASKANNLEAEYLSIKRNHIYNVVLTVISGDGYDNPTDAYESMPGNVDGNIVEWEDDGTFNEGIWNNTHYIRFSSQNTHFTQFATPSPQVIRVKTNLPELTFDNFTNITKGPGDANWAETANGSGIWTNNHFRMEVVKGTTVGEDTEYTLTVTAKATTGEATDPARDSRFKIKGKGLEASLKITQDAHVAWRLLTDPDPMNPIMIDGSMQRIRVDVTSTHPYDVVLNNSGAAMFTAVYDAPAGGNMINPSTNISPDTKTVYVVADNYSAVDPRISTFVIRHTEGASEAAPLTFNVLQVTPMITAVLEGGVYKGELRQAGGSKVIRVESNMSAWMPVLKIKVGAQPETTVTNDVELTKYFGLSGGSGKANVTFTAPAILGEDDVVYTITFRDGNSATVTKPEIVITQIAKLPATGGGGTPPTGGVRAEEMILSVNAKGQLNLDGTYADGTGNWIVYFKWGSTVALGGTNTTFGKNEIAWTPEGFPYEELKTNVDGQPTADYKWQQVPYQSSGYTIVENNTAGTGDPCKQAIRNGVVGGYKMPADGGSTWFENMMLGSEIGITGWYTSNGSTGRYNATRTQFYPAAGRRNGTGGLDGISSGGYYWTETTYDKPTTAFHLSFHSGGVHPTHSNLRNHGFTIRCVEDN